MVCPDAFTVISSGLPVNEPDEPVEEPDAVWSLRRCWVARLGTGTGGRGMACLGRATSWFRHGAEGALSVARIEQGYSL